MKRQQLLRAIVPAILVASPLATAQFTSGNLVVVRVGTGAAALTNASNAVFLEEFTVDGTFVQSVPLPTAVSGLQFPVTVSGSATSEGLITLSADGQYLVAVGYGTAPGLASVVSTPTTSVPRVIARIGLDGSIDSSTAITDAFSANNIRSATTDDGSRFWAAGANSGVRLVDLGASTSLGLNTTGPLNNRLISIQNGQLYVSSSTGAFRGVSAVGTGLPTEIDQTVTLLNGFPTTSGPSTYDYFFADAATLYTADDRTNGSGGIEKWTFDGSVWTLSYLLAPAPNLGFRGLSGIVRGGKVFLFGTGTNSEVYTVVDEGPASAFTSLATPGTNTVFRGLRLLPPVAAAVGTSFGVGSAGFSGTPVLSAEQASLLGFTDLELTGANLTPGVPSLLVATDAALPFPLPLFGLGTFNVSGNLLLQLTKVVALDGTVSHELELGPTVPAGITVHWQLFGFDGIGGNLVSASNGLSYTTP